MTTAEVMRRLGESVSGGRSFGPAFERDGCMVIPVAYVVGGGGGGSGVPPTTQARIATEQVEAGDRPPDRPSTPSPGDGGGFGLISWPMGAYVVKDGEVTWRPMYSVADLILLVLGSLWLLGRGRRRRGR